jgi:hypothetical protein
MIRVYLQKSGGFLLKFLHKPFDLVRGINPYTKDLFVVAKTPMRRKSVVYNYSSQWGEAEL